MKKRGFTLVELLAVIVILSIIALIAVPVILGMIEDSRKQAAAISGKEYVDYVSTRIVSDKLEDINFHDGDYDVYNDGREVRSSTSNQIMDVKMKGTLPVDGWIKIKNHQVVEAWLVFGKYEYHYILTDDGDIIQTITKVGEVAPDINLILQSTTNSITATVERKNKYKIKSYRFKLDDKEYHKSNNNQYIFTKLNNDKEYSVTVECINTTGGIVIVTSRIKTKDIDLPTYKIEPSSGWATEKTVTITYPKKTDSLANPIYEYKVGKDNDDLNNQSWIRTDKDSFSYTFKENGVIVARVSDGNNYKIANSLSVEQIDNTPPTKDKPSIRITTKSVKVTNHQTDLESGILNVEYSIYKDGTWSSWQTSNEFTRLKNNTQYKVKTKTTNGAGASRESEVVEFTTSDIPIPNLSTDPKNGWSQKKIVTINYPSENATDLEYYFRATVDTTSNVDLLVCEESSIGSPENCKNKTKNLKANTWYKSTNLTIAITFTKNGTLTSRVTDGYNYKNSNGITIAQIDTTGPDTTAPTVTVNNSGKVTLKSNQKDNESGIKSVEYYYRKTSVTSWTKASSNVISGLTEGTNYIFKTEATNNAGIKTTSKESETKTTCSISAPVIKVTSGNQYVVAPSKTVGVTFASNCGDTWKYEYSINGGPWIETKNNPFSYTFKENGTIAARVSDDSRIKTSSTLTLTDISPYMGLSNTTYNPGDSVEYAGEKWKVVKDNDKSVTLILAKNYTTAAGTYGINRANQFYNANANLQSEASNGGLVKHSETGSYVRLIKKDEVSSLISNDSGTPFWTMTSSTSEKMYYALSNGATSYTQFTTSNSYLYAGYAVNGGSITAQVRTNLNSTSVSTVANYNDTSVITGSTYTASMGYYSSVQSGLTPTNSVTIGTINNVGTRKISGNNGNSVSNGNCKQVSSTHGEYGGNDYCMCSVTITGVDRTVGPMNSATATQQYCAVNGISSFSYTKPQIPSFVVSGNITASAATAKPVGVSCTFASVKASESFVCTSNCTYSEIDAHTSYVYASPNDCSQRTQYTVSNTTSAVGVRPVITVNKRK